MFLRERSLGVREGLMGPLGVVGERGVLIDVQESLARGNPLGKAILYVERNVWILVVW